MKILRLLIAFLVIAGSCLLPACGGNSGTGTSGQSARQLTGVAAAGAPIIGTVTVKDARGTLAGPAVTDSSGGFSVDIAGLTPPFFLKVEGKAGPLPYTLYSATTRAPTVHINPFTNLILAVASGMDPAAAFGPPGAPPGAATVGAATLEAALSGVHSALAPLLTKYGIASFDPLNGAYSASPNDKVDAMLDLLMLRVETGTVTLTNKLTGAVIATGPVSALPTISVDGTKGADPAALDDVKELTARLAQFQQVIAKGTTLTLQDAEDYFLPDPSYGTSSGRTRSEDMGGVLTIYGPGASAPNGNVTAIRNLRLVRDITADYAPDRGVAKVYVLNYDFIHENGVIVTSNNVSIGREVATGRWKFVGDPAQTPVGGGNYGFEIRLVATSPSEEIIPLPPPVEVGYEPIEPTGGYGGGDGG